MKQDNSAPASTSVVTISTVTETDSPLVRVESMTSRQLVRRAKLIETVIELVGEVGGQAVQMRDVADRSGVALGTAYRYFRSKDHLLAVALTEWQERLTRRVLDSSRAAEQDPLTRVVAYLQRALRAFHRNPAMARLMVRSQTSEDPDVAVMLERMSHNSKEVMDLLLAQLPARERHYVRVGIDSTLMSGITSMVSGRSSLDETIDNVVGVAELLLARYR